MTDGTDDPTHTPLYLGRIPEDAICERHGEMMRQSRPLLVVDGHIHTAIDGVFLYGCPECCIDLFAIAGEPTVDPEQALTRLWNQYIRDDWEGTIEHLFVDLGLGDIELRDGRTVVLFDEESDEAIGLEDFRTRTR